MRFGRRRSLRRLSKALVVGLGALWFGPLFAPCAMSAAPNPCDPTPPCATQNTDAAAAACPLAVLDCDVPQRTVSTVFKHDIPFQPTIITMLPAVALAPPLTQAPATIDTGPPPVPTYLTHLTLLL